MKHADLDLSARAARRTIGNARSALGPSRTAADPRGPRTPQALARAWTSPPVPAATRPLARFARDWPLWIVVGVGSAALVAAGYLGALVQLGAMEAGAVSAVHVTPESPQRGRLPRAESTSGEVQESPSVVTEVSPTQPNALPAQADIAASRARTRNDISKAAARATAELERELYQQPPAGPTERRPDPAAPEQPNREAVQQVLLAMRPQIEACGAGQHGTVDASVTIASSGRVTYSLIRGDFAGTEHGSCMARALRTATFPTFAGRNITVQFPFAL